MAEKRQPPLWLDMSFGEALERFAGTDPQEVAVSVERAKEEKPPGAEAPGGGKRKPKGGPDRGRGRQP